MVFDFAFVEKMKMEGFGGRNSGCRLTTSIIMVVGSLLTTNTNTCPK